MGSFIQCAQLGLQPGKALGEAWLIPYNNSKKDADGRWHKVREVNLQLGYKGLQKLACQGTDLIDVKSVAVYENEEFIYEEGLQTRLIHKPVLDESKRGELKAAYAVGIPKDPNAEKPFRVLGKDEIEKRRKYGAENSDAWNNWYDHMAKKTAVRALCDQLPKSANMAVACRLDDTAHDGVSQDLADLFDAQKALPEGIDLVAGTEEATTIAGIHAEADRAKAAQTDDDIRAIIKDRCEYFRKVNLDPENAMGGMREAQALQLNGDELAAALDMLIDFEASKAG